MVALVLLIDCVDIRVVVVLVHIPLWRERVGALVVVPVRLNVVHAVPVGVQTAESVSLAGGPVGVNRLLVDHLHLLSVLAAVHVLLGLAVLALLLLLVVSLGVDLVLGRLLLFHAFSLGPRSHTPLALVVEMSVLDPLA